MFNFHGRAGAYFILCLTNLMLCIITFGIYIAVGDGAQSALYL
ncbi:DUF898 family protein [Citrobacter amalonaticus]